MTEDFIQVRDLYRTYHVRRGLLGRARPLHAVDGVSFSVEQGGTFGLVGESGSGKSTIAKVLLSAEPATLGQVSIGGTSLDDLGRRALKGFHRTVQPVLQDPYGSLSPLMRIEDIIDEPMRVHGLYCGAARDERILDLLLQVGLAQEMRRRYPHELSGGQRQRVAIARALGVNPQVLVLDEPVSALDVSVQAQILNLLKELQEQRRLSYVLISHDLAVVAYMSSRIGVLYLGQFMELGTRDDIVRRARHPYTHALIASSEAKVDAAQRIGGEIPSPMNLPSGCRFHTRCPHAIGRCRDDAPLLRAISPTHHVACHLDLSAVDAARDVSGHSIS